MARRNSSDQDRSVTLSDAFKFTLIALCVMAGLAVIKVTWPASGLVLAGLLFAAFIYFRNKRSY